MASDRKKSEIKKPEVFDTEVTPPKGRLHCCFLWNTVKFILGYLLENFSEIILSKIILTFMVFFPITLFQKKNKKEDKENFSFIIFIIIFKFFVRRERRKESEEIEFIKQEVVASLKLLEYLHINYTINIFKNLNIFLQTWNKLHFINNMIFKWSFSSGDRK